MTADHADRPPSPFWVARPLILAPFVGLAAALGAAGAAWYLVVAWEGY